MRTRKMGPPKDANGKALKTPGGRKVKAQCSLAANARPAGPIFAQTHAEHGAYMCAIWCFAHKMRRGVAAALTGLDKDVIADLYRNLRMAASWETIDIAEGEMLGSGPSGDRVVVIDEARVARRI